MTALTKSTQAQSIETMILEQLDSIYYPGYTEEIDAEKLEWEMKELLSQFSVKK